MEGLMIYDPRLDVHVALRELITYWYSAPWGSRPKADSCCLVRMFAPAGRQPVVVLTELPENQGMSVTNAFEFLAADIKQLFALPEDTVWVEHYTDRREGGSDESLAENFALVSFEGGPDVYGRFGRPVWKHLEREDLFGMLEGK